MKLDVRLNDISLKVVCRQLYEHRGDYTPEFVIQTIFTGLTLILGTWSFKFRHPGISCAPTAEYQGLRLKQYN